MRVSKFMNEAICVKNYFKQVSSWQYIQHVRAAAVTIESVHRYKLLSTTLILLNVVVNDVVGLDRHPFKGN